LADGTWIAFANFKAYVDCTRRKIGRTDNADLNIEVTLKVNLSHMEPIRSAMERFDYQVLSVIQAAEMDEFLHDRWKNLENYLNIE
jgi:hypothetical protein